MSDFEVMKAMIERSQGSGGMLDYGATMLERLAEILISDDDPEQQKTIEVRAGYEGFLVQIYFRPDGSLLGISAWE